MTAMGQTIRRGRRWWRVRPLPAAPRAVRLAAAVLGAFLVLAVTWATAVAWTGYPAGGSGAAVSGDRAVPGAGSGVGPAGGPGAPAVAGGPAEPGAVDTDGGRSSGYGDAAGSAPSAKSAPMIAEQRSGAAASPGVASPGAAAPGPDVSVAEADRSVVRTATLALTVGDVAATADRVRAAVTGTGGYVSSEQSVDRAASFTVRVPATRLDELMTRLAGAGQVTERSAQADDVTGQVADLQARLDTQRASVARVRALLDRATTVGDVVMIESELTQRQADLESLEKRVAAVNGRVALSTLSVRLAPAPVADPGPAPGGFVGGVAAGWRAFLAAGAVLLTVVGAVLPFGVLVAVLVAAGLLGRRAVRRGRAAGEAVSDG
ncbi:MAG TPA: DUF4349 domain-containing protein [Pseudonocardia sp.]